MEQFWNEHKVFFLATLVLFPDKLMGQQLDPWFFRPYFNFVYSNNFGNSRDLDTDL